MTRRELEVTDAKEIQKILDSCLYLHLGLVEDGKPYVVTMNYVYEFDETDNHLILYLHSAVTGKKLEIIEKNPQCSFTMECNVTPFEGRVACQYGMVYESISGGGNVSLLGEPQDCIHALEVLMKTQTGKDDFEFDERMVSIVRVMQIDVTELTAKRRPLPEGIIKQYYDRNPLDFFSDIWYYSKTKGESFFYSIKLNSYIKKHIQMTIL